MTERMGRLMGESLARGAEREWERKLEGLEAYMKLIALEIELYLGASPYKKES